MIERVESYTQPGVFYDLTVKSGLAINCTCPDCVNRERVCKHMTDYNSGVIVSRMDTIQMLANNVLAQYRSGVAEPEGARTLETFLGINQDDAASEEPVAQTSKHTIVVEIRIA
ncbi:MAG: hypothetical protein NVS4B7_15690 [Ktedonobacteraceae bacterium]